MQSWTFFPCFVIFNHTLQAVTEVIVGAFKIFLGQPLSSIMPQELGGVSTTLCAPSACAHSGEVKNQQLKPKALKWQIFPCSHHNFKVWGASGFQLLISSFHAGVLTTSRCMQLNRLKQLKGHRTKNARGRNSTQ